MCSSMRLAALHSYLSRRSIKATGQQGNCNRLVSPLGNLTLKPQRSGTAALMSLPNVPFTSQPDHLMQSRSCPCCRDTWTCSGHEDHDAMYTETWTSESVHVLTYCIHRLVRCLHARFGRISQITRKIWHRTFKSGTVLMTWNPGDELNNVIILTIQYTKHNPPRTHHH